MSVKIYSSLPIFIKNEINNTKTIRIPPGEIFTLELHFIHWKNFTILHNDSFQFFILLILF